jgi:predicted GIY-YIG superfamily endonuclease
VPTARRFVYILRSVNNPERRYVGSTSDPRSRLKAHNEGLNASTARWMPWFIDICIEFRTESMAVRFEKDLKSGSGHTFANRHFREAGLSSSAATCMS